MDFRLLFESTPSPYLVIGPDLVIVEVNPAYLAATAKKRAELVGTHIFTAFPDNPDLLTADGVRNLRRSLETVLATGQPDTMPIQRYDIPVGPDGAFEERHWSPVNTPVTGPDGDIRCILHRAEDVTELVAAHPPDERLERLEVDLFVRSRELKAANDRLAEAGAALRREHQAKDRFFAAVAHDLRTPLSALRAAAEVLSLDVAEHRALGVLDRQVAALTRMTDDLLDAGRVITGNLRVDPRPLDLREVVADAVGPPGLHGREVLVSVPDEPVVVLGDRVRLGQAVGNLLSNAVRYSSAGTPVRVGLVVAAGTAEVAVVDSGIGFDPALAEVLFQDFTRVADTRTGGLGLGLAIARGVVSAHGGTVTAHSDGAGTGARFALRLPLFG
ncbi:PAS domain-containing sensor histidine kinase [Actinokineospora cianjurensis]|uniref:histidine kinase n=1 Tax=Actinokineospora cianjurensis TaxID=585224 RepID=A0A421B527_9PSEU|nr:PAS domain-containing sensor histidine kinase [Actinokineospora cianjurensis]RLK59348.1 PAS domain-containing protein [Actinokineospora cianjurensis]